MKQVLSQIGPGLPAAMAFMFGLAWFGSRWPTFEALMNTLANQGEYEVGPLLLTLLPALIAFAVCIFFTVLVVVEHRRKRLSESDTWP